MDIHAVIQYAQIVAICGAVLIGLMVLFAAWER